MPLHRVGGPHTQADVYSLGVTLWEMVERQRPWAGMMDAMQLWTLWVTDPQAVVLPPLTVDPHAGGLLLWFWGVIDGVALQVF